MRKNISIAPESYLAAIRRNRQKRFRNASIITTVFVALVYGFTATTQYGQSVVASLALAQTSEETFDEYVEEVVDPYSYLAENGCNVLGVTIYGDIGTYSYGYTNANDIRSTLKYAQDEQVKAILVEVDSEGGSMVGGDEIKQMLDEQPVPVVGYIRELGASAGYLSVLSADTIFMHKYGSVGSIGVIYPHYDYTKKNQKDGIQYDPILSAPKKDAGSPDRPMTKEERAEIQRQVNFMFNGFIDAVSTYRGLSQSATMALADGSTYLAEDALELGLIDAIGGQREVRDYLSQEIGEEAVVCWDYEIGY